jgi:hypothetical protein
MYKYVCSNNANHKYEKMTPDGFCSEPECYGVGFLIEAYPIVPVNISDPDDPESITILTPSAREIGLCILVMDASGSMNFQAFPNSPALKKHLIAASAAGGIFDLNQTTNIENAYVCGIMFDTKTNLIFMQTVSDILKTYSNPGNLADFLKSQFNRMRGRTDINKALKFAKEIYDDFMNKGDLSKCNGPANLRPIMHTVFDKNNDKKIVPNVRVFIYTDGQETESTKIINPFKEEEVDILMGCYFGPGEEKGCRALREIVSKCPKHDFEQFFLINDPGRIQTLRRIFRMASGASGFCPLCLSDAQIPNYNANPTQEIQVEIV